MRTLLLLAAAALAADAPRPLDKVTTALKSKDLEAIVSITGPELETAKAQASDAELAGDDGASKRVKDFQALWVRCRRLNELSAGGEVSVAAAEWAAANLSPESYDRFMSREQKVPALPPAPAAATPAVTTPAPIAAAPIPKPPIEAPKAPAPKAAEQAGIPKTDAKRPPSLWAAAALFLSIMGAAGGGYLLMTRFKA